MKVYDLVYHSRIHYVIIATAALAQQMSFSKALSWKFSSYSAMRLWKHFDRWQMFDSYFIFSIRLVEESQQEFATARLFVNKCIPKEIISRE